MTSPSENDGSLQGIRGELRVTITHPAEQRFDAAGAELIQFRGQVVDAARRHPEVVVRFGGSQRNHLFKWAKPGQHLLVIGSLEFKVWNGSSGQQHYALLVEASSVHPLRPHPGAVDAPEPSKSGVYTVPSAVYTTPGPTTRTPGVPGAAPRLSKTERAAQMRALLETADG